MNKKVIISVLFILLALSLISGCTQLTKQTEKSSTPPRNYPAYIKGVWEPIPYPNQYEMIKYDLNQLKDDGVNTIYIIPIYPEKSSPPEYTEKTVIEGITKARQEGFAVFICPDIFIEDINDLDDLDEFLESLKQFDLKWAKISEEYNVEYFAPVNELYTVIRERLGYQEDSVEAGQLWKRIDNWHQEILLEIRNIYTGKIAYKPACVGFNWNSSTITLTGYDIFAPNMPVGGTNVDEFEEWLDFSIPLIIDVVQRDNVDWMVGEYWIPAGVSTTLCETGLNKIENATIPPIGLAFGGWTCKDGPVKNTSLEKLIKEWWSKF